MDDNTPGTDPELEQAATLLSQAAELLARLARRRTAPPPAPVAATVMLPPPPGKYLDTKAAAAVLGVTPKGLEAMRARGAGPPYVRVGRRVRYRASQLPGARK